MNLDVATTLASERRDHGHMVEFYEADSFMVSTVVSFVSQALLMGDVAIVVATEDHRDAFAVGLRSAGIDVDTARENERYVPLDASETCFGVSRRICVNRLTSIR
jgi:hypothetical protein